MSFSDNKKSDVICSFCGKRNDQVKRMLAGRNGYICDECIELCSEVLKEEYEQDNNITTEARGRKIRMWNCRNPIS